VYGSIEQLLAIGVTEVAFPLMAGFRTDGFVHRIPDDELGDVPEGRNRLGGFPRGPVGLDRVEPAGNELPRLGAPFSSVLEADGGIGAETLVLPNTSNLIAQDLFLTARLAHDEVEAVAAAMPTRLCRLHPAFRQSRHPGPTSGPTL
jgi:hypothetical protein